MTIDELKQLVAEWDGILVVTPGPGDGTPEVAWGDSFIYYAPDGRMPTNRQPFATIVTKDYPGDDSSQLERRGVFRVNVHPGRATFDALAATAGEDAAALDEVIVHPVYGPNGWLAVLNPGDRSAGVVRELLREAYEQDRDRVERRAAQDR